MNEIERIKQLFLEKPYLIRMGANSIARMHNLNPCNVRTARNQLRRESNAAIKKGVKILIFDIEIAPLEAYVWRRWKQNIYSDQVISDWFILSWSAKWLGDPTILGDVLTSEEAINEDDKRVVMSLWDLFDEADIVVAHNGDRFDVPKMNSRFIVHGLNPPSPYKQIDTLRVAQKEFGFSSNKLDELAGHFGVVHKDETTFDLWKQCKRGDANALKYMFNYNKKDVYILEKVYLRMRPWIKNHPNIGLYLENEVETCGKCGSTNLVKTGTYTYTSVSKFPNLQCMDCGGFVRRRTSEYPKDKRTTLLTNV